MKKIAVVHTSFWCDAYLVSLRENGISKAAAKDADLAVKALQERLNGPNWHELHDLVDSIIEVLYPGMDMQHEWSPDDLSKIADLLAPYIAVHK